MADRRYLLDHRDAYIAGLLAGKHRVEPWWLCNDGGAQFELAYGDESPLILCQGDPAEEPELYTIQTTWRDVEPLGPTGTDGRILVDLEWGNARGRCVATVDAGQSVVLAATMVIAKVRVQGQSATGRVHVAVTVSRGASVQHERVTFTDERRVMAGVGTTGAAPVPPMATQARILCNYTQAGISTVVVEFGRDVAYTAGAIARQLTAGPGNGPWLVDVPREARFWRAAVTAATSVQPVWLLSI